MAKKSPKNADNNGAGTDAAQKRNRSPRVTLREFQEASRHILNSHVFDTLHPGFRQSLLEIFPSKSAASSLGAKAFRTRAMRVALGQKYGLKVLDGHRDHNEICRATIVRDIMNNMPTLRAVFAQERKKAEEKYRREAERQERKQKRPESLRARVERLERENRELRAAIGNRPMSAEEELEMRKWYQDNDNRIGGHELKRPIRDLRD